MTPEVAAPETAVEPPWYQWYEVGVPRAVEVPDQPLPHFLAQTAARYPARAAIRFMGHTITYRELDEAVSRFANALIGLGLSPGDRVALVLPNCPQFIIAYYGGLRAGAVIVPINPLYAEDELRRMLADAEPRAVVCLSMLFPKLQAVRADVPSLEQVIVTNIKEYLPPLSQLLFSVARERKEGHHVRLPEDGHTHWLQPLLERAPATDPGVPVAADAVAALQYTAGTTGVPKGVMLTHRSYATLAFQAHAWTVNVRVPDGADVVLGVIPLFHTYAQTTVMNFPIFGGGTTVLLPRFSVTEVLRAIDAERPTLFPGVPALYGVLAAASDIAKYDLHSIKACICGSAPLSERVQTDFETLSGARVVEGYGLTEAPVTHCNPIRGERRIGSIGIPIPGTEAAIVDLETGTRRLAPGEIGELAVRGPQLMQGYRHRPEETAQVMRDGWLLTGDVAQMDADGFFKLVDRKKDMINTGGLKVFPSEVEDVVAQHPSVKEVAAIGIPDARRGEVVKVFVVLQEGERATEHDIIVWCQERMARYKVPRAVEFRAELPKGFMGKILRRRLGEEERPPGVARTNPTVPEG